MYTFFNLHCTINNYLSFSKIQFFVSRYLDYYVFSFIICIIINNIKVLGDLTQPIYNTSDIQRLLVVDLLIIRASQSSFSDSFMSIYSILKVTNVKIMIRKERQQQTIFSNFSSVQLIQVSLVFVST